MSIHAACACGAQFRVKPELAGKRVQCPKCGQPFLIPDAPQFRPIASEHDTIDIEALARFKFQASRLKTDVSEEAVETRSTSGELTPSGVTLGGVSLERITGIAAICYGGFTFYRYLGVARKLQMILEVGVGLGFYLIQLLISPSIYSCHLGLAITGGMFLAGIGILKGRKWGVKIGVMSAYAHFILLAIFLLSAIPSLPTGFALLVLFLKWLPCIFGESLGPVLILILKYKYARPRGEIPA